MTALVKVRRSGQVTLPSRLRSAAGLAEGDLIEASVKRGRIILTPKPVMDRSKFPSADDDYTPEQRRIIDARLAESTEDIAAGRLYGPFDTHEEMVRFLHHRTKKAVGSVKAQPKAR
jgi:AbrB family looped-hinge helix DNA binding protein